VSILYEVGKCLSYKIWIGYNERSYLCRVDGKECSLADLSDFWRKPRLLNVNSQTWNFLKFIDILWIKDQRIHYAFEIENTTSFTKAFDRCSNIPLEHHAMKVIVIPRKRKRALLARIQSNLIQDEIKKGNWYILDFGTLEQFKESNRLSNNFIFRQILEQISQIPRKSQVNV
jgi:hypothetical protein